MDDNHQKTNDDQLSTVSQVANNGQQQGRDSSQVSQNPHQPVSAPNKEMAPPVRPAEQHVKPTEHQIEISQELKEAGVERSPDTERPELPPDVQQQGVKHSVPPVVIDPTSPPMVQLPPYKREEVLPHAQNGPVTDAARWFYTLLLRQIDKVKKQNLTEK